MHPDPDHNVAFRNMLKKEAAFRRKEAIRGAPGYYDDVFNKICFVVILIVVAVVICVHLRLADKVINAMSKNEPVEEMPREFVERMAEIESNN